MATLDRVNPELRQRVEWVLATVKGTWVESAFRDPEAQKRLYKRYVDSGYNKAFLAAKPGRSNHERGLAVDLNPTSAKGFNQAVKDAGLHQPVPGEKWHLELKPGRGPCPPLPTKPATPTPQEDEMDPTLKVDAVKAPDGGTWVLQRDGGVFACNGAPFYGSYPGLKPEQRQGARYFVKIQANGAKSSDGYSIIASDGNVYSWAG